MQTTPNIMLDLETLGVNPGCVILSIGAITFDPRRPWCSRQFGRMFESRIEIESCEAVGLMKELGSLKFWYDQPAEAQEKAFGGERQPLREVLQAFAGWFRGLSPDGTAPIWCQGANFDIPILQTAYRVCLMDVPWHYRSPRDTRTVYDLAGVEHRGQKHDALEDCYEQCEAVCRAFGILGLQEARS